MTGARALDDVVVSIVLDIEPFREALAKATAALEALADFFADLPPWVLAALDDLELNRLAGLTQRGADQ